MDRIPTSFQLGGNTFQVERVSAKEMKKRNGGTAAYGMIEVNQLRIYIEKPSKKISESVLVQTFWHEFAHAVLWTVNHKDYTDENLVDALGHAFKQAHDTMKY